MNFKCPGSQKFSQPQPEIIRCLRCGEEVEIWTDEVKARCPKCKDEVTRDSGQSCLDWCRYAKECVGEAVYKKYMENMKNSVKYMGKGDRPNERKG